MDFGLTPEHKALQQEVIAFAQQLNANAGSRDAQGLWDRSFWNASGAFKLPGLPIALADGGRGLDAFSTAVCLEALGFGSADNGFNFSIAAHMLACTVPIWKFGSDDLKAKYLGGMCDGRLICANSITEPNAGSDSTGMRTRAVKVEGGYRINGNKIFISNGPVSDISLLYAVTDAEKGFFGSMTAFVIESGTQGFKIDISIKKMGMRTALLGEQVLENVFVPDENVVGEPGGGGYIFNHSMEWERAILGAIHVGAMRRVITTLVKWVKQRDALRQAQSIQHTLAEMKVKLEAATLLLYKSAWQLDHTKLVSLDASISKLYVSEAFQEICRMALSIMGNEGYSEDDDLARQIRDAASATIYSGTSEMQKNIIAKWMGL